MIEIHPWQPFIPQNARILMCGTFPPPQQRWSMEFYYPNFINDMWRIFGLLLHGDKDYFVDVANKRFKLQLIKEMLEDRGIALSDTGREVVRTKNNASDKFLAIIKPLPLKELLDKMPLCTDIVTTGEKAAGVIAEFTQSAVPKVGTFVGVDFNGRKLKHWRMPSTSRAYPLALDKKAEAYGKVLLR